MRGMSEQPRRIEYHRPGPRGRSAIIVVGVVMVLLEIVWLGSWVLDGGWILLVIATSVAVVGAIIGWFAYKRLGIVVMCCLALAVAPMAIWIICIYGVPRSAEAFEQVAIYSTLPFVRIFLLPALIGGLTAAVLRPPLIHRELTFSSTPDPETHTPRAGPRP